MSTEPETGSDASGAGARGSAAPSAAPTESAAASWDDHAEWWQREFTDGAASEYTEQIIPTVLQYLAGRERVLDVGAGEGQIARALAQAGAEVVGLDPTMAQIRTADERAGGPVYALGVSDRLPVRSSSFDGAVVCLVYEHIDTLEESLAEVARVLRPGGRLVLIINHPLFQTPNSGLIVDHMIDPPETYWRVGAYLHETATVEEVSRGVHVRFVHRPLSRYLNEMIAAGIDLVAVLEPAPPPAFTDKVPEHEADVVLNTPRLLALIGDRHPHRRRRVATKPSR